jgi:hypothetical protein
MTDRSIDSMIAALEAKKKPIEGAIAALRALQGHTNGVTRRLNIQNGQTIIGAVLAHLKRVGIKQTNAQLREAISSAGVKATESSIQTLLSKRAKMRKDLVFFGHGMWGLKR